MIIGQKDVSFSLGSLGRCYFISHSMNEKVVLQTCSDSLHHLQRKSIAIYSYVMKQSTELKDLAK